MTKSKKAAIWLVGTAFITALGYKLTTVAIITKLHFVLAIGVSAVYVAVPYVAYKLVTSIWQYFSEKRKKPQLLQITLTPSVPDLSSILNLDLSCSVEQTASLKEPNLLVPNPVAAEDQPDLLIPAPDVATILDLDHLDSDATADKLLTIDANVNLSDGTLTPSQSVLDSSKPQHELTIINANALTDALKRFIAEEAITEDLRPDILLNTDPVESESDEEHANPSRGEESDVGSPIVKRFHRSRRNADSMLGPVDEQYLGLRKNITPVERLSISSHKGQTYEGQVAIYAPKKA